MRPKPKNQVRKQRRVSPRSTLRAKPKRESAKRASSKGGRAARAKQFAQVIWPRIKDSTKFVELPEFQTTVTYTLPSGEAHTASLNWYSVSHGSRIFGHYDDKNDVCYIGKFVE